MKCNGLAHPLADFGMAYSVAGVSMVDISGESPEKGLIVIHAEWILGIAFAAPFVLGTLWVILEWWCSRGTAMEKDITVHRLKEHHGFDPTTGDPVGWNRAKGDLAGAIFVLIVLGLIVIAIVFIMWFLVRVFL